MKVSSFYCYSFFFRFGVFLNKFWDLVFIFVKLYYFSFHLQVLLRRKKSVTTFQFLNGVTNLYYTCNA